jgi:hypothetical protein
MTAQEIIKMSLRKLGVIATGETPTNAELQDGLDCMNMMLRAWVAEPLLVYGMTRESLTLTGGTYEYTIGSSGDLNTTRPEKIESAYVATGGIDYPMHQITHGLYDKIAVKTTGGIPNRFYYNPVYSSLQGKLYIYPSPEGNYTLYLTSVKVWTDTSALTSTVAFPGPYDEVIMANLALSLAPEYGANPSAVVVDMAKTGKRRLKALNAANRVEPVHLEMFKLSRRWNINQG